MPDHAQRPERYLDAVDAAASGFVEQPLSAWQRIVNVGAVRKLALLVLLAAIWEAYARWLDNPLLLPTFSSTVAAFLGCDRDRRPSRQGAHLASGASPRLRARHHLRGQR
jgi:hypothetical protein